MSAADIPSGPGVDVPDTLVGQAAPRHPAGMSALPDMTGAACDQLEPHPFAPVTFHGPDGEITSDWCGHGALCGVEVLCGRLAGDPVHQDDGAEGAVMRRGRVPRPLLAFFAVLAVVLSVVLAHSAVTRG